MRQIKRSFGDIDQIPVEVLPLLVAISKSYDHYEQDRELLNRSMDISSNELAEANEKLRVEAETQKKALNQLKSALFVLTANNQLHDLDVSTAEELSIQEISELIEKLSYNIRKTEDRLYKVNSELKEFAYVVSHDLKAPLRSIGSLCDWLISDYHDKLDEEGRGYLNLLKKRVTRLHKLVEGILHYSRIGRTESKKTMINTNKLITEIIDLLAVEGEIVLDDLPEVYMNEVQLRQVFQNLISNAVKYNDKEILVLEISCETNTEEYVFRVADNGSGIKEKYFDRIFKIFQTLEAKDVSDSTGVGLTIVKKIILTNGGKVWVESEVGKGTEFYFSIPKKIKYYDR